MGKLILNDFSMVVIAEYRDALNKKYLLDKVEKIIVDYCSELRKSLEEYIEVSNTEVEITLNVNEIAKIRFKDKELLFTRSSESIEVCENWSDDLITYIIKPVQDPIAKNTHEVGAYYAFFGHPDSGDKDLLPFNESVMSKMFKGFNGDPHYVRLHEIKHP